MVELEQPLLPEKYRLVGATKIYQKYWDSDRQFCIRRMNYHMRDVPHVHNYLQLWYVSEGCYLHHFVDMTFEQKKGNLLLVPPEYQHFTDFSTAEEISLIACDFSENFLIPILGDARYDTFFNLMYLRPLITGASLVNPCLSFDAITTRHIEALLDELLLEFWKDTADLDHIRINLIKLITEIIRGYEKQELIEDDELYDQYRTSMQQALDYIDEHYMENIPLNNICNISLMSPTSFSFLFKRVTGHTFTEYISLLRVCHARKMLVDTSAPITRICQECGFYDSAQFTRMFKRFSGVTPREFRKRKRAEAEST